MNFSFLTLTLIEVDSIVFLFIAYFNFFCLILRSNGATADQLF